jgi:hypothetical protein
LKQCIHRELGVAYLRFESSDVWESLCRNCSEKG